MATVETVSGDRSIGNLFRIRMPSIFQKKEIPPDYSNPMVLSEAVSKFLNSHGITNAPRIERSTNNGSFTWFGPINGIDKTGKVNPNGTGCLIISEKNGRKVQFVKDGRVVSKTVVAGKHI